MVESTTPTTSSSTTSSPTKPAVNQNGVDSSKGAVPKFSTNEQQVNLQTVPKGKYTLVGIDIDTTGRRLIDEVRKNKLKSPRGMNGTKFLIYLDRLFS